MVAAMKSEYLAALRWNPQRSLSRRQKVAMIAADYGFFGET